MITESLDRDALFAIIYRKPLVGRLCCVFRAFLATGYNGTFERGKDQDYRRQGGGGSLYRQR